MSKLSFRARALDATKPLPIYLSEEIPETADCSLINRAVPQMPTGMEKEEEAEHHLQQAIVAGTVIPTPEVYIIENVDYYDRIYPEDYKMPRQLIYMQPFSMETDIPDYDMDSEDEQWMSFQAGKLELSPDKFEEMMDRLEKGSGQTVVTLQEAKALIKEDDDLIIAVYDYWLNKRLKTQHPLIPHVRTEARHGVANHNPYIAFRRRTEKMQTRKNRKNDESSYEKMLKLKRDLTRAVTLLEMVKRREKSKRELLHLTLEVFEKRYQAGDYNGTVVSEALQQRPARPAFTPLFQPNSLWIKDESGLATLTRKERRHYKKRRHKSSSKNTHNAGTGSAPLLNYSNSQGLNLEGEVISSDEELIQPASPSEGEEEDEGVYAFKRKRGCQYYAPKDNSEGPWCSKEDIDKRYRFYPTSIQTDLSSNGSEHLLPVGPCRLRVGRGGRISLDRMNLTDLRDLCRVAGFNASQALASLVSNNIINPTKESSESIHPEDSKPNFTTLPRISPEIESSSSLQCWYNFHPKSPERTTLQDLRDESSSALLDVLNETHPETEEDLKQISEDFGEGHLGLMVAGSDRPLLYTIGSLGADPPLFQDPLINHSETLLEDNTVIPVLDDQTSDLANTCYLMEFNNELLVDDINGETTEPWFSSIELDAVVSSGVDKKPDLSLLQDLLLLPTSSNSSRPPGSSSFHQEIKLEPSDNINSSEESIINSEAFQSRSENLRTEESVVSNTPSSNNERTNIYNSSCVSNDSSSVLMHNKENSRRVSPENDLACRDTNLVCRKTVITI